MITALVFAAHGSRRAGLIWLGSLGYMLYNYIFYLYGAAFNSFFLVCVALFSLSSYALVLALMKTDVEAISRLFNERTPVNWIGGFMLFFAVPWSMLEVSRALNFVFTGQLPQDIVVTCHPTGVVYATDLSLLMPAMILGGVLLFQRRAWGYLLASIILFKGTTYGLALIAMSVFAAKATGKGDPLTLLYIFLTVGSLVSLCLLLANLKATDKSSRNVQASLEHSLINH